jgi:hypothetical protein
MTLEEASNAVLAEIEMHSEVKQRHIAANA